MSENKSSGTVDIHGRTYKTVALRVEEFRRDHPLWTIETTILEHLTGNGVVVMRASIANDEGRVLATGHASERKDSSQINRTSALENCETSAIGRALAAMGYGGSEFASADEVANAIHQQNNPPPPQRAVAPSTNGDKKPPTRGSTQTPAVAQVLGAAVRRWSGCSADQVGVNAARVAKAAGIDLSTRQGASVTQKLTDEEMKALTETIGQNIADGLVFSECFPPENQ